MIVTWAAIGVLTAALFGTLFYLGAKIDNLGIALNARVDGVVARVDDLVRGLAEVRVELAEVRMGLAEVRTELAGLGTRFDRHVDEEHGQRPPAA